MLLLVDLVHPHPSSSVLIPSFFFAAPPVKFDSQMHTGVHYHGPDSSSNVFVRRLVGGLRGLRSAIPSDAGEKLFSASTADPAQEGDDET
ncbi:hypothetical protein E4U19_005254 [Claviceps sp. Clav32 group G5]|nr:hypothetical protein E4U40_003924 [Claviceps sp. LM458 group G5]KAG6035006.1 hypothetical protein E4U19_005254 [Claviceps sp. Clav32 group G5]